MKNAGLPKGVGLLAGSFFEAACELTLDLCDSLARPCRWHPNSWSHKAMIEAERLFNNTFFRTTQRLGFVYTFRQVVLAGIPLGAAELGQSMLTTLSDPSNRRLFRKEPSAEVIQELSDSAARRSAEDTHGALDSASLIFAHTIVDDASYQYCRVSALAEPTDWDSDIERTTIRLGDLRQKRVETHFEEAREKKLRDLERGSLLAKIDVLFAKCKPGDEIHTASFTYQKPTLERLDQLRHAVVHGDQFGKQIPSIDEDLRYFSDVAMMMMVMINGQYGFKINPALM